MAKAFVEALSCTGVDAVKFQTHIPEAESTDREAFRVKVFPQDATRSDYWRRTGFQASEWMELADYSRRKGLEFLSSPFSEAAIDLLLDCRVPAWKVASGEICNTPLLEKMAETNLPVLLSSGMSSWIELDAATRLLRQTNTPFGILQCTSAYPCPPESWGLNIVPEMESRYQCPVGLSDHSGTVAPSLASITLGASILEFHVTFHPQMFGPDVLASLTIEETKSLVSMVRKLELAFANPVDKDDVAANSSTMRRLFSKSIVAAQSIPAGTILNRSHLAFKKPGDGIPAGNYSMVLGRTAKSDLVADQRILDSDLHK
ncbi:MAG: N-acetylneuraminate synthase family protein [Planctomycetes bacterium]|nr:N-acetylneuraminate synthase family protein [Planctomycetota bacterium]